MKKLTGVDAKKKRDNIYLMYTVLFCAAFLLSFGMLHFEGKAFIHVTDGLSQTYTNILYTRRWILSIWDTLIHEHQFVIPMWDLNVGFGQEIFGNVISFRPLILFTVFFPEAYITYYVIFRLFVTLYLAGVAFVYFLSRKGLNQVAILLAALAYTYGSYSLYFGVKHTMFIEMMLFLPLILCGVEDIFESKFSNKLIVAILFSVSSYFYFLYMITIAAVIYALFLYIYRPQKGIKDFFSLILRAFVHYVIGIGAAAVAIFPAIYSVLQSSRAGGTTSSQTFLWSDSFYVEAFKSILEVNTGSTYHFILFSSLGLIGLVSCMFAKFKKKGLALAQTGIYALCMLVPILSKMFNGFGSTSLRWNYIFAFWLMVCMAYGLTALFEAADKTLMVRCIVAVIAFILIYAILGYFFSFQVPTEIAFVSLYLSLIAFWGIGTKTQIRQVVLCLLIFVVLGSEIRVQASKFFGSESELKNYYDLETITLKGNDSSVTAAALIEDESVFRVDAAMESLSNKYTQMNYGIRSQVNGLSSYFSLMDANISETSLDLGNSQQNVSFLILDWDQRTVLNEVSGVKYLTATDESDSRIPYGYELIASTNKTLSDGTETTQHLYENQYALPIAFTYDSYIPKNIYNELKVNEKEQALLQGVVLENEYDYPQTSLQFDYEVLLDKEDIIQQITENYADSIIIHEDGIEVLNDATRVELIVDHPWEGELSVEFDDILFEYNNYDEADSLNEVVIPNVSSLSAKYKNLKDTGTLLNSTYQYYMGKRDLLLNVGMCRQKSKIRPIKITFGKSGYYSFSDVRLICQPMYNYGELVDDIKNSSEVNVAVSANSIMCEVQSDESKFLYISVPYSKGWSAYVDGEKQDILVANGMYMALSLEPGEHNVELRYVTPWIKEGLLISIISLLGWTLIAIIRRVKNEKKV